MPPVDPPPEGQYPPPFDPRAPIDYPSDYPDPPLFGAPPGAAPPPPAAAPMPPGYFPPPGYPPFSPPGYPPFPAPAVYDPYAPYPFGVPPGQNGPSLAALVCALLGVPMCMCFLPSLAAILLGIIGIQQTGRTGQSGRGLAIAGLVIGATTALLGLLVTFGGGLTSVLR